MNLKTFLKKYRLSNNLTQTEFSSKIGITQWLYSNIESGKKVNLTPTSLHKIAVAVDKTDYEVRKMYESDK